VILGALFAATIMMAQSSAVTTPSDLTAAPPAPAPANAAPAKKADKDGGRLICKSEAVTGSLFPKKTCYRADEMAQRKQEERMNLERSQSEIPLQATGK
jgi:hypothetical protein